ncbi:hypothetical protein [Actinoplanes utahensis]|uniref:Uncharacterized protein n=1 Tax=Actinoplanes utahensis TaxID=1869 RepID=A0A0A6UIP1_ACTUT|nr:hypothetical protein [Actinoplanes utahensis]KHD75965.1 hypothetical protein MB27_20225 [Actinoplanes utahensis]GIF35073.1 hypothetical protein Aut01nite_80590 [Actinoplanes utahensis]
MGEGKAWADGTDFRLEPNGMEWFVLTPTKRVASRGTGTLNGRSGYTWLIYGVPGGQSGKDQLRLVVFETECGTVVYDSDPLSIHYDVDVLYLMSELTSGAVQVHLNLGPAGAHPCGNG